jgi:hypothetical protein
MPMVSRALSTKIGSTRTAISYPAMINRRGVPIVCQTLRRPGSYCVTVSEKSMVNHIMRPE